MPSGFASARVLASLSALALLLALGGCVAAAALAVPAMTAIGAATRDKAAAEPAGQATALPAAKKPEDDGDGANSIRLLPLTELPAPSGSLVPIDPADAWGAFIAFALSRAPDADGKIASAMLSKDGLLDLVPQLEPCVRQQLAVLIDLDQGGAAFEPGAQLLPSPALASGLDELREAGVLVMWISKQDPNRVGEIADALLRSGLDPTGRDPILLTLGDGDRKQTLREQAASTACIVAIAGDERQDFDELFGYLRRPEIAGNFDPLLGAGWFILPHPLPAADQ